jgi:copper transport protein
VLPRTWSPAVRGGLVALLAGVILLGAAPPAEGHSLLRRSNPPEDVRLAEAPEAVTLEFTEPPEVSLSSIQVLDRSGAEVGRGEARPVAGDPHALEVGLDDLADGVYTVQWRVVSAVDGHPTGGFFAFGVRVSPFQVGTLPPEPAGPRASPLEAAGRWVLFLGLGLLLGASWVGALGFREIPRSLLLSSMVACGVAVVGLVVFAVAQADAAGASPGELAGTDLGRALLWRGVGLAGASALVLAALPAWRGRRPALAGAGVVAALVMLVHVESGHAAAQATGAWPQILAQWVHIGAASVWLGGLAALLLGIRGEPAEAKAAATRRFSAVAAFALAAVVATGVVRALDEVGSWGALFSTGYGLLVVLKSAVLLLLAGLGAVNRFRNVPLVRRTLEGLRRVGGAEVGLGVLALAAAAVLATLVPPATVPALRAAPAALTVTGSDFATSVRARLEVDPAVPGPNRFRLRLTDFDSGDPVDADRVELRFASVGAPEVEESTLQLRPGEDGLYEAVGANLAVSGPWDVTALVQRGGNAIEVPLRVATECQTTEIPGPDNLFTIEVVELPGGETVEGYLLDVGYWEVHFTFLDPRGREVGVLGEPTFMASGPGDRSMVLSPRPLSRGHFTARADLEPGRWRFDGIARSPEGGMLSGCFEQAVEP